MRIVNAAVVIGLIGLGGCTGGLFHSKISAPATYVLALQPPPGAADPASGAPLPVDLMILRPLVRPGLESDRIAAAYPDHRLEFYAGARWNGSVEEIVQDLAVRAFQERSRLRSVSPEATRFASGYWLEIAVEEFAAQYRVSAQAPTIVVHFNARFGRSTDHTGFGTLDAQATRVATADRLQAIVEAYEGAANEALSRIIDATMAQLDQLNAVR